MLAIGYQQCRFDLRGVGVQLRALMAKERIDRRHAHLQQGEKGHVKLAHVAKLHQRRFTTMKPQRLQPRCQVIHGLVKLAVRYATVTVDDRHRIVIRLIRQDVGQRQILPVAFFTVAPGKILGPTGKGKGHECSLMQTENIEHGGEFYAGFTPLAHG